MTNADKDTGTNKINHRELEKKKKMEKGSFDFHETRVFREGSLHIKGERPVLYFPLPEPLYVQIWTKI